MSHRSLISGFRESAERFPERPAVFSEGKPCAYAELRQLSAAIAQTILDRQQTSSPLAAVLAHRGVTAYAAILGILQAGKGYVPLNPKFPVERTRKMLDLSRCSTLVVDALGTPLLPALLADAPQNRTVILPDSTTAVSSALETLFPQHVFVPAAHLASPSNISAPPPADPNSVAYLMFTSGSTGEPKGVPISHSNVRSYLDYTCRRYNLTEHDRFSQAFDLTFDLSVHDMFVCWERGACLYPLPDNSAMLPAKFIRDHQLTMWFSVPSVAAMLAKTRLLQPRSFPSLRYSLFCGEPLAATHAQLWQDAAPQSILENLYGPTEATIAISNYHWNPATSPSECKNGIVPIGWPFAGQQVRVLSSSGCIQPADEVGELCLSGSQITCGYWNNPQKTHDQFIRLPDEPANTWYRTGDLVTQRSDGCLLYFGRVDQQVKIRGYRVELQEVEGVLRKFCGFEQVAAVPWPVNNSTAEGIVAFVAGASASALDSNHILASCRNVLPDYMVPRQIRLLEEMPRNANGKIDRVQLTQILAEPPLEVPAAVLANVPAEAPTRVPARTLRGIS